MSFIISFLGALVLGIGMFIGFLSGNWGLAFAVLSIALALITISNVFAPPGWAFKQANRLSKPLWVLIGIAALFPPLGWIYFAAWLICGRTIRNAWIATDPDGYRGSVLASILASHW